MQTPFLGARAAADLIAQQGLAACLRGMAKTIEHDFQRWHVFQKGSRLASHSAEGVIELMPISDGVHYSFKYVNGHPKNSELGLPTVMAFGLLADVHTGLPLFLSELTLTTALRTAATSALLAQHMARKDCRRMALIGNGVQSEFQAMAFHAMLGIDTFHVFDIDPQASRKLAENLYAAGMNVILCETAFDAVQEVDVITTITADKTNATILRPDMVQPGVHINAVGGDCPGKTELHPDVLRAARVVVEYEPQTRIEGDIQQMPASFPVLEAWQVLSGHAQGRLHETDITVFDSVGFALEDFSALRYMHHLAARFGKLQALDLIPELENPKNLYGCLSARGKHAVC